MSTYDVTIAVKLQKTYLHDGAIPTIFPNCPSYLSSLNISREALDSRIRLENSALKNTLNQSITDDLAYKVSCK